MSKQKLYNIFFFLMAAAALTAIVYHTKGYLSPTAETPAWRHALFIGINTISFYGLLQRPRWFIWFWAALTLQQMYSHGSYAWKLWSTQQQVHWISVLVVLMMPVILLVIWLERRAKRRDSATEAHS